MPGPLKRKQPKFDSATGEHSENYPRPVLEDVSLRNSENDDPNISDPANKPASAMDIGEDSTVDVTNPVNLYLATYVIDKQDDRAMQTGASVELGETPEDKNTSKGGNEGEITEWRIGKRKPSRWNYLYYCHDQLQGKK